VTLIAVITLLLSNETRALELKGIDCGLSTQRYAVGFRAPLGPIDVDGDGSLEHWYVSNEYGNLVFCEDLRLPCTSDYWHHTGEDYLIVSPFDSAERPVYAVDNGVVVFSTESNPNPKTSRGGLVVIKHVAPPGVDFYVPSFEESYSIGSWSFDVGSSIGFAKEIFSYYLHLGEVEMSQGDEVYRGELVGRTYKYSDYSAETYAYVPHLHFEIWDRCSIGDRNGYDMAGSQFEDAANDLLVQPRAFLWGNKEVMRAIRREGGEVGELRILGSEFWYSPGEISVLGLGVDLISLPLDLTVADGHWNDQMVDVDIFENYSNRLAAYFSEFPRNVSLAVAPVGASESRDVGYPFRDVQYHSWYSGAAMALWKMRIVDGYGETGFFLPEEKIKRAEFLKLIVLAVCPSLVDGSSCVQGTVVPPFGDVATDDWFYVYIREAWNRSWLDASSSFRPHDFILRSEAAKFVALALGLGLATYGNVYSDVSPGDWFAPYVLGLTAEQLISGYPDKTFKPGKRMNRAEALALVSRALY
jgi:hypothetical protein